MKEKNNLAYDQLNDFLYNHVLEQKGPDALFSTYAVYLVYSHDIKENEKSIEVFEVDICNESICWFNDWWEGQPFITLIGIINIEEIFNEGNYHVLVRSFNDESNG